MRRIDRLTAVLMLVIAAQGVTARGQYGYPVGYGPWGWNGWGGGGGGGSTVQGSIAQGMGVFAQGLGSLRQQTAAANVVNSATAMQWNEYLYQSQLITNRRYQEKLAKDQKGVARTREAVYQRLRDNPTPSDIARGDALNVALDEINNPKVYLRNLKGASTKVEGTLIRDIPFQYAQAAITTSVDQLIQGGPPEALKSETFAPDREALKKVRQELHAQNEENGEFNPATIKKAQEILKAAHAKVEATYPKNTPARRDAEKYIKGLYGLTRMLETPAINVLLAGVEKRPDTTLNDLLTFMKVFNLRFGVAQTARQKAVYTTIYPLLVQLRNEAASPTPEVAAAPVSPGDLFTGTELKHLDEKKIPAPPDPGK